MDFGTGPGSRSGIAGKPVGCWSTPTGISAASIDESGISPAVIRPARGVPGCYRDLDHQEVSQLTTETQTGGPSPDWTEVYDSPEFQRLRSRFRRFVFPMTALFLAWYALYVLLADYAHHFISQQVAGNITVGLVFGLLQFLSTFVITGLYVRYADRTLDPMAERIRAALEGEAQ
ncbi:DUF485 domain-containing protein [Nocardia seriolae]|nr:DUF485 domain-containing protein [Nocardia seriolae]MTJ75533.1 DUF485 domain-containing protein [Nocardia seriolae]MTJ89524.1 DUF485 domain-containing protein [Nocardia seriolae]MTK33498.1 DUF485 domain-containing protein [Nocardia seriolae]MTK42640.1 DUF485 domain-containing protein [Nocardia seriolae]